VPVDQGGKRPGGADHGGVERPDRIGYRPIVRVDQKRCAVGVAIRGGPRRVHLLDPLERETGEIVERVEAAFGGRDPDVGDVQEQAAAGSSGELGQELDLVGGRGLEAQIGRGVLEQHPPAESLSDPIDMAGQPIEARSVVGHGQEVVQINGPVAGPGEVLGEGGRLVTSAELGQASQMDRVERRCGPQREGDAVQRERQLAAQGRGPGVRRPARAHQVLGVDLEEAELGPVGQELAGMGELEADAGTGREGRRFRHGRSSARAGRLIGSSEPGPYGVRTLVQVRPVAAPTAAPLPASPPLTAPPTAPIAAPTAAPLAVERTTCLDCWARALLPPMNARALRMQSSISRCATSSPTRS
jgi:hypothetical protein